MIQSGGTLTVPTPTLLGPMSLSGLQLWLDATVDVYQDSGFATLATANNDPVGGWKDQSGNGNHATQTTNADRPHLSTSQVNSRNAVYLDNNTVIGMVTSLSVVRPFTIAIVEKPKTTNAQRTIQASAVNSLVSAGRNSGNNAFLQGTVANFAASVAVHSLFLQASGAATSVYLVDNVNQATGSPASNDFGTICLGASGQAAEYGDTYLCELLVYNSFLTTAQIATIYNYFQKKWGAP